MDIELDTLNAQQRLAVTAPMQPVLVLAGAGSGKTRVLAYRVIYLIKHGLVDAPNILALTFTNKAASEMKERVTSLLQADGSSLVVSLPHLSTFHSLGVKILRQHGYLLGLSRSFVILDTEDQLRLLKDVFTAEHIEESIKPQAVLHFIHAVKNTGKDPEEVAKQYRGYLSQQFLAAYRGYQRALMQQGSVDLDDLICLPERLLREISEVRGYYQHKFRYILVDEYQDTNPIQYQLLRQLAPPAGLFVVGDDAQSIYGFRGSDISNILNFERDFPNATVVVLDQNYRSTQNILAVADAVLKHSVEQKPKVLWTENLVGQKVVVQELSSEVEEADFIVRTLIRDASPAVSDVEASVDEGLVYEEDVPAPVFSVLDYMLQKKRKSGFLPGAPKYIRLPAQHLSLARYAILYRTHAQSRAIEAALMEVGVPYRIVGGLRFYDRREVKDILSYVRVLYNLKDVIALRRAFASTARGIGEKTAAVVKELVLAEQVPVEHFGLLDNMDLIRRVKERLDEHLTSRARSAVTSFLDTLLSWLAVSEEVRLHELLQRVVVESGLMKQYRDGTEAGDARVENLQEFVSGARKYESMPLSVAMQEFLEEVALMNDGDDQAKADDVVTLMTLHAVKGLEFDVVFFAGLEEGLLPHSRSMMDPAAFAEEVRLAYVGVTRAREKLYITYTRQRGLFGESRLAVPSRLLRGLPEVAVDFKGRQKFLPNVEVGESHGPRYEPFYDE